MRIQKACLVGVFLLSAAACSDRADSPVAPALQVPDRPFYYYQGEPVYLTVDPTRIIVQGDEVPVRNAVADAARAVGLGADVISSIRDHRIVALNGSSADQADRMVNRLRQDSRVEFASKTYRTEDGGHSFQPLNRIDVAFESGASTQIAALIERYNLSVIREPQPGSGFFAYVFAYPREADPIIVAQRLHDEEGVEWAAMDVISDIRPSFVPTGP
ncbi:MAG: hypothetical protein IID07_14045 [Gemmatimonadetes bacterium]|nr:hypothetical protein [Gemmatimonadota bacterium]